MTSNTMTTVSWDYIQTMLGITPNPPSITQTASTHSNSMTPSATLKSLLNRQCKDGERTQALTQLAGMLLAKGASESDCIEQCIAWNERNLEPLDEDKVINTCQSICLTDQANHPERYSAIMATTPLFDLNAGRIDNYMTTDAPPRRWLLQDLIVLGKAGAVIAPGGFSKSQWLLQLAVGVSSGIPVAGHWQVGETGSVLVFCAEDDEDEIHRRLSRIRNYLFWSGNVGQLAGIEKRLFVFSTIGTDTLLTKRQATGEVVATDVTSRIMAMARHLNDLRLIVIDPASRFRGGDENKNEDATRFVEALEALAKQTGASVLIAHHASKASLSPDSDPSQGASRGASALTDGLRWQMNLNKPNNSQVKKWAIPAEDHRNHVVATVTKTNYSAFPEPVLMRRTDEGYLEAVNAKLAQLQSEQAAVMRVLRILATAKRPMSARKLEEHHGGIDGDLKMPKQTVREIVKTCIEQGLLGGGARKPLQVTALGESALKAGGQSAEEASGRAKTAPRDETQ